MIPCAEVEIGTAGGAISVIPVGRNTRVEEMVAMRGATAMSPKAKAKKSGVPTDKLELFDKLIAVRPEIERKGANNAYAAVNGNMFLLMQPDGVLAIRLPEEARGEFLKKYKAKLHEAYGVVIKEYVAVPDALVSKTKELQKYVAASYDCTRSLKRKPTKKSQ